MDTLSPCPNCGGHTLYQGPEASSGGGHAPDFLAGLGSFWRSARVSVVVCRDCGLLRFFAAKADNAQAEGMLAWCYVGLKDTESFKVHGAKAKKLGYKDADLMARLAQVEAGQKFK